MPALPRGITGFREQGDLALPQTDLKAFRATCYAAARSLQGTVGAEEAGHRSSRNHGRITLDLPTGAIVVLIHDHFPLVAFSKPGDRLKFTDHPALADSFAGAGYQVVTVAVASARTTDEVCQQLGAGEIQQIRYWQPYTVGDLIFNDWD